MVQHGFFKWILKACLLSRDIFNMSSIMHTFMIISTSYDGCHNTQQFSLYNFCQHLKRDTPIFYIRGIPTVPVIVYSEPRLTNSLGLKKQ